jgi:hypothetical protein
MLEIIASQVKAVFVWVHLMLSGLGMLAFGITQSNKYVGNSNGDTRPSRASEDWIVYPSTAMGLAVELPQSWKVTENPARPGFVAYRPLTPGQNISVSFQWVEIDPGLNSILAKKDDWTGRKVGKQFSIGRLAGSRAFITAQTTEPGDSLHTSYVARIGERALQVDTAIPLNTPGTMDPRSVVEKLLESIRLK